ncbi:MAG: hypothetical protein RAO92_02295 [Candidatus Euphemobacter frigidus]|nr:hypothetical protein [Candidatus Euphemobacter frigidus]MDP8275213.1 hypothetical protein [Candidatus Euphemobacter frigidus]
MKIYLFAGRLALLLLLAVSSGCASSRPVGLEKLDGLQAGMTIENVIIIFGEPTSFVELRDTSLGETYHDLTYVNTIVKPGVVELYFRPALSEIRLNTEIYKVFTDE